jgi:PAS domain-containing protein
VTPAPPSLVLILARELAANLATPMFLIDAGGTLVFCNEAAELMLGKAYAELGAITANEFGAMLELAEPDGTPLRRRDSPAGIAFYQREPAHRTLLCTTMDGVRRKVEVTAYPLFGHTDDMHGVLTVFWESKT